MILAKSLFAHGLRAIDSAQHHVYGTHKTRLLGGLEGTVVEIGPGTGLNLAYLNRDVTWIGIEPNNQLHPYIHRNLAIHGIRGKVLGVPLERASLPHASADAVISTLVLCSVPDVSVALTAIQRLLKPGGQFVFIEHIADAPDSWHHAVQETVTPLWSRCFDGCHPNRRTDDAIEDAGFTTVVQERFSIGLPVVRPHCAGYAVV